MYPMKRPESKQSNYTKMCRVFFVKILMIHQKDDRTFITLNLLNKTEEIINWHSRGPLKIKKSIIRYSHELHPLNFLRHYSVLFYILSLNWCFALGFAFNKIRGGEGRNSRTFLPFYDTCISIKVNHKKRYNKRWHNFCWS